MVRRLPPLNALRAFEAAGRHLSFTKAAEELHVTPAAVSHQVKALEQYLGVPLFRRLTRALLLTDAGQAALPLLHDGFDRLEEAVERMRAHETGGEIKVSAAPTFAAKWLVPRLGRFRAVHPDIDVRIDANMRVVDLSREDVDNAALEKEREVQRERFLAEGKPENIVDKIVDGQMNKFYEENCLLDQEFVKAENKESVEETIKAAIAKIGENITIARFARMKLGEE